MDRRVKPGDDGCRAGTLTGMCGIIGILGREPVAPGMVDALKRLEYRGYDFGGRRHAGSTAS